MATRIGLLGPPAISFGDDWLWPQPGKTTALLLYLAYRDDWVSRVELVDLFWRDTTESVARTNLRSLLSRTIATRPYAEALEIEATRVRWRVTSDASEFRAAVAEGLHAEAYRAYGSELLEGFVLEGAAGFAEWLTQERSALSAQWLECALKVCGQLEAAEQWARAAEVLGRLLEADPFDESILRRRLVDLSKAGQSRMAREAFERFRDWLAAEVGAEPEPETAALLVAGSGYSRPPARRGVGSRLPTPASAIVGREAERKHLVRLLSSGPARLVTLTGPGGIGKTRLALCVAHDLSDDSKRGRESEGTEGSAAGELSADDSAFRDGVYFVACETATGPEGLVTSVADAVGLPLIGPGEPRRQLLDYLAEKGLLLVLDNLEQLRGRLTVLDETLECAPHVRILTTSRELLGSRSEHVVDLPGLDLPPSAPAGVTTGYEETATYGAVALFASCGSRVRDDFELTEENIGAVVRICRLVAGMPLAIELAASWLRALRPEEIAAEIASGLDILSAAVPAEGDRHSSLRAVFDYSWSALAGSERRVLARFSIFAGSFDLAAAKAVAGATVEALNGLVNRSLLVRSTGGRYGLHPLVRSYAGEKLIEEAAGSDVVEATRAAHCAHYTRFLAERADALGGGEQLRALDEIAADIDNVRAALAWATVHAEFEALQRQLLTLAPYYTYRCRFHEMAEAFRTAERRLRREPSSSATDTLLGFVLAHLGWSSMRLGRYQEADALLLESMAASSTGVLESPYPGGDPRLPLSLMASIRGELDLAVTYGEEALRLAKRHGNDLNERIAHYALARAANGQGRFEDGEAHGNSALDSSENADDRWFMGDCLLELGDALIGQGRVDEAESRFTHALGICREFDNRGGVAEAMNRRAALALRRSDFDAARRQFLTGLEASEYASDAREIARAECGLAEALAALDEPSEAATHFRRALHHAARLRSWPLVKRVAQGALSIAPGSVTAERVRQLENGSLPSSELPRVTNELEIVLAPVELH